MEADHTTKSTIEKLQKRKIDVETYQGINPGQLSEQLNQIRDFITDEENLKKIEHYKFRFPLCLYVFDDFRENLKKHPEIANLFTKNRHYKVITIVSSQRYKDIQTCARMNTQVLILTKGLNDVVLKAIFTEQPIHITYDEFKYIYEQATTRNKYDFLFCDLDKSEFRINFDEKIIL